MQVDIIRASSLRAGNRILASTAGAGMVPLVVTLIEVAPPEPGSDQVRVYYDLPGSAYRRFDPIHKDAYVMILVHDCYC